MSYNPEERIGAFVSRLGRGSSAELIANVGSAFQIAAAAREKAHAIRRDTTLTPTGHKIQIARMVAGGLTTQLTQLKSTAAKQLQNALGERAALAPKLDKADLVGELQRAETRNWLSRLSRADQLRALQSNEVVILEAVVFAPLTPLSGVSRLPRHW